MSTAKRLAGTIWNVFAARGIVPPMPKIHQRAQKLRWTNPGLNSRALRLWRTLSTSTFVKAKGADAQSQAELFRTLCEESKIRYKGETFLYSPDFDYLVCQTFGEFRTFGNLPVDCDRLLRLGVRGISDEILNARHKFSGDAVAERSLDAFETVCNGLIVYHHRCLHAVDEFTRTLDTSDPEIRKVREVLERSLLEGVTSFREALQTILICNSMLWTYGMDLVGLGRLDRVLFSYYKADTESGRITDWEVVRLIKEFLRLLHRDFYHKSNALAGDTGQVICLAGRDANGQDTATRLTHLFLQASMELGQPDPKLVIRIHRETTEELWESIVDCTLQKTGNPLLSNDERVIPALEGAGYLAEDAVEYVTSACWEPCIPTSSVDQNNLTTIDFMAPLNELLDRHDSLTENFSALKQAYFVQLRSAVEAMAKELSELKFVANPLLSILTSDCIGRGKDISEGGARYFNFGVTGVAFGNVVNALLNIDRKVYRERRYTVRAAAEMLKRDFFGAELELAALLASQDKFGTDSEIAVQLANEIIGVVYDELNHARMLRGRAIHFGVSSPSHISYGSQSRGSMDGRRSGTPYGVHISATASTTPTAPTEGALFAAKLDYSSAFNGGVFDLVIDHMHVAEDRRRFREFLRTAFSLGLFQFQANLIDLELLKKARKYPELYPHLIVRVWGFSAYFKDLPVEYQKMLIARAEAACS